MVAVQTAEELIKAIQKNEQEILIDDEELARRILSYRRIKTFTRRLLAGVAIAAIAGIVLSFFFGEVPALMAAALTSLGVAALLIEIFLGMRIIGIACLYTLDKNYSIDLVGCSTLKIRVNRIR
jgi:hypothetical protein